MLNGRAGCGRARKRQWNRRCFRLYRRWRRLAYRPLADTIAATALENVEMDVALVIRLAGPKYGREAMAGALAKRLAQRLVDRHVYRLDAAAVREPEGAHVDRVPLGVFAELGALNAIAIPAFVGIVVLDCTQRRTQLRHAWRHLVAHPGGKRFRHFA